MGRKEHKSLLEELQSTMRDLDRGKLPEPNLYVALYQTLALACTSFVTICDTADLDKLLNTLNGAQEIIDANPLGFPEAIADDRVNHQRSIITAMMAFRDDWKTITNRISDDFTNS